MDLYIKITSGTRKGDVFKLQPAITLGRSKADINLKDSKASSLHAKILEENGALFYLDLNSTNGSLVAGEEIKKIKLIPGLIIVIGATQLEISTEFDVKKTSNENLSEWRETLFNHLQKLKVDQSPATIVPFKKCVVLTIKSGVQSGTSWVLGYGPRMIGPASTDLCLIDETLDDMCMKVLQRDGEIVVESVDKKPFIVDGHKRNTEILKDRLSILVGNTLLELGFLDETI